MFRERKKELDIQKKTDVSVHRATKVAGYPEEREPRSTYQIGTILLSVVYGRSRRFQSEDHDPLSRRLLSTGDAGDGVNGYYGYGRFSSVFIVKRC